MIVLSQLLGRYSSHNKPLILFRLPETNTLLYRQSDIEQLFSLPPLSFQEVDYEGCYRDHEDTYLNTQVLDELAEHFKRDTLVDLCKFQPNDYALGLADKVLDTFPQFKRAPKEEHIWESVQLPLENLQDALDREAIKPEPSSPPSVYQSKRRNSMALDKVLIHPSSHQTPSNKRQRTSLYHPCPSISEGGSSYSSSTRKNARNLTIFAPSYTEHLVGIQSAPIHSNFNTHLQPIQPQRHEFAIPPIVPSQQPHSAHPTSQEFQQYYKPHGNSQRQNYLQPFEQLFDTIEATRKLKSTLDDQIRKSSSLIQALQASVSTIESHVRIQVQKEWEKTVQSLVHRVEALEDKQRVLPSPDKEESLQSPIHGRNEECLLILNTLKERIDRLEKRRAEK